jgi:hypothetical protein
MIKAIADVGDLLQLIEQLVLQLRRHRSLGQRRVACQVDMRLDWVDRSGMAVLCPSSPTG